MRNIFFVILFILFFYFSPYSFAKEDPSIDLDDKAELLIEEIIKLGVKERTPISRDFFSKDKEKDSIKTDERKVAPQAAHEEDPSFVLSFNIAHFTDEDMENLIDSIDKAKKHSVDVEYSYFDGFDVFFISFAQSDGLYDEIKEKYSDREKIKVSRNLKIKPAYSPNDPYYPYQWGLTNIRFSEAMDITTGAENITVAVLDNGVDVSDTDLKNMLWTNSGEIPNDLIDNDGNGYRDDVYGCNFYLAIAEGYDYISCDSEYIKEQGGTVRHGSYIASVIAGQNNNGWGISGVCPKCKIMVLNFTDYYGIGYVDILPYTLAYAIDKGADIINYSYGSACPFDSSQDVIAPIFDSVINTYSVNIVQAVGNNGNMSESECKEYCGDDNVYCSSSARNEAYYYIDGKNVPNKINVGAIDSANRRSAFSNYDLGYPVTTLGAPGQGINVGNGTTFVDGTSFSAPFVSGAIGTLLSTTKPHRSLNPADVKYHLYNTGSYLQTDRNIGDRKLDLFNMLSQAVADNNIESTNKVYVSRFWSDTFAGHFFTAYKPEAQHVMGSYPSNIWRYEGVAYYAFATNEVGTIPVYRFWSPVYRGHFYTVNEFEKDYIIENYVGIWEFEGISFYAYSNETDLSEVQDVYRFWSPTYGHHFFTINTGEKDYIINTYPPHIWTYEGVAWKVPTM